MNYLIDYTSILEYQFWRLPIRPESLAKHFYRIGNVI